jgi:hypothetical protein
MNHHYARDKGILAALDYLGVDFGIHPTLRRVKQPKKAVCRPSTGRILAIWWMICVSIKP